MKFSVHRRRGFAGRRRRVRRGRHDQCRQQRPGHRHLWQPGGAMPVHRPRHRARQRRRHGAGGRPANMAISMATGSWVESARSRLRHLRAAHHEACARVVERRRRVDRHRRRWRRRCAPVDIAADGVTFGSRGRGSRWPADSSGLICEGQTNVRISGNIVTGSPANGFVVTSTGYVDVSDNIAHDNAGVGFIISSCLESQRVVLRNNQSYANGSGICPPPTGATRSLTTMSRTM